MASSRTSVGLSRLVLIASLLAGAVASCGRDDPCVPGRLDRGTMLVVDSTILAAADSAARGDPEVLAIVDIARHALDEENAAAEGDRSYSNLDIEQRLGFLTAIDLLTTRRELATPDVRAQFRRAAEHSGLQGIYGLVESPTSMLELMGSSPEQASTDPGPGLQELARLHDEHLVDERDRARDLVAVLSCSS